MKECLKHGKGQHRESAGLWPDMYLWTKCPEVSRTPLKVLLGLFQSTDVKDLIELSHHTPDVLGRKPQFSIA